MLVSESLGLFRGDVASKGLLREVVGVQGKGLTKSVVDGRHIVPRPHHVAHLHMVRTHLGMLRLTGLDDSTM